MLIGLLGLSQVRNHPRIAAGVAGLSLILILACSTPLVGTTLVNSIEIQCRDINSLQGEANAIVILGGGIRPRAPEYGNRPNLNAVELERLRHGARIHRATGLPILLTGGSPLGGEAEAVLMREILKDDFGIETRWVEPDSRTTRENARNSAQILKSEQIERIYLVSQGWHLARATSIFESEGLTVTPMGTGCKDVGTLRWFHLLPNPEAFGMSYWAFHESIGILWYDLIARVQGRNAVSFR